MSKVPVHTERFCFTTNGQPRTALLRTPPEPARRPSLLIDLCGTKESALDESPYNIVPGIFLAAGHCVASFDLPRHGERADAFGEGLMGMAAAIAAGIDVFADVAATGRALIDHCVARGLSLQGAVVMNGTSRGGLSAMHVMAADPRVAACAVHAPVTDLPTLREFAALKGNPIIGRSNAMALADRLADRPLFIAIGSSDPRVDANRCREFHAAVVAASVRPRAELFITEGASHADGFDDQPGYHAAAAFLLRVCAEHTRQKMCDGRN